MLDKEVTHLLVLRICSSLNKQIHHSKEINPTEVRPIFNGYFKVICLLTLNT